MFAGRDPKWAKPPAWARDDGSIPAGEPHIGEGMPANATETKAAETTNAAGQTGTAPMAAGQ